MTFMIDEGRDTLETTAQRRQFTLERLDKTTRELQQHVRDERAAGASIDSLAKRAGVTRATIYSWLEK